MKKSSFINFGLALLLMVLSLAFICGASQADMFYGDDATGELSGSRAAPTLLTVTENGGATSDWGTVTISWDHESLGGGQWKYKYTFTNYTGFNNKGKEIVKNISHFTLDISQDAIDDVNSITSVTSNDGSHSEGSGEGNWLKSTGPGSSTDGMTGAVKFDWGTEVGAGFPDSFYYMFESNRAPVYGDFYLKDGGGSPGLIATNLGFLDPTYDAIDTRGFIVVPNGAEQIPPEVPEPSLALLLGISLIGLVGVGAVRRIKQKAVVKVKS